MYDAHPEVTQQKQDNQSYISVNMQYVVEERMATDDAFRVAVVNAGKAMGEFTSGGERKRWTDRSRDLRLLMEGDRLHMYDAYAQYLKTGEEHLLMQYQTLFHETERTKTASAIDEQLGRENENINLAGAGPMRRALFVANWHTLGRLGVGKAGKMRNEIKGEFKKTVGFSPNLMILRAKRKRL